MASRLYSSLISLGIFLSLWVVFTHAEAPMTGEALIKYTCGDTEYYDLCVSSFESDPRSLKAYYKDLGPIYADLVIANASGTRSYIKDQLASAADSENKTCFQACYENYSSIVDGLNSVLGKFKDYDFQPIVGAMRSAESKAEACEDGFKKGGLKSPITARNEIMRKLANNGFVIMSDMMV